MTQRRYIAVVQQMEPHICMLFMGFKRKDVFYLGPMMRFNRYQNAFPIPFSSVQRQISQRPPGPSVPLQTGSTEYLDSTLYKLDIHLQRSAPEFLSAFDLQIPGRMPILSEALVGSMKPLSLYQTKVGIGADISARFMPTTLPAAPNQPGSPHLADERPSPTVGTLGCYVQLLENGIWDTFILSSYQVARPAFDGYKRTQDGQFLLPDTSSELYRADLHGFIKPNGAPSMGIQSPSQARHNKNVILLEKHILTKKNEGTKQLLRELRDKKTEFFDNEKQFIGHLFAGSGLCHRTYQNATIDWLLIKPEPSRIGLNTLPQTSDWPVTSESPEVHLHGTQLREHIPAAQINPNRANETFFKYGAISKATAGEFSRHKHDVRYRYPRGMKYATEIALVRELAFNQPDKHPLCNDAMLAPLGWQDSLGAHGDSGSIVYDPKGRGVGLLFSGTQIQSGVKHLMYVWPLELTFDDIRRFLGARVTGIRIAQLEEKKEEQIRGGKAQQGKTCLALTCFSPLLLSSGAEADWVQTDKLPPCPCKRSTAHRLHPRENHRVFGNDGFYMIYNLFGDQMRMANLGINNAATQSILEWLPTWNAWKPPLV